MPSDEQLVLQLIRDDFEFFVISFFEVVRPEVKLERTWYVSALCHEFSTMIAGPGQRLIINLPPRALKSTLASVLFPAWYLGRLPDRRVICASYSDKLASQFSRDFRRVIEHPLYRAAFPRLKPGSKSTETEILTSLNGYRVATSVGGTITGRGANLIIVDDPINASDITSEAERNRVKDWFDNVVQSRLDRQEEDHILVVMQRLHEDDLTGHLLAKECGWKQTCYPVRNTGDDRMIPLGRGRLHVWPSGADLMPRILNRAAQQRLMTHMPERTFSAQYLQEPLPTGGAVFQADWMKSNPTPPPRNECIALVQSWDVAVKPGDKADFTVCTTWAVTSGKVYHLLDLKRVRLAYHLVLALARQLIAEYHPAHVLVEDAANGSALTQELARDRHYVTVGIRPRLDKLARAQAATPAFESGRVLLPPAAEWRHEYQRELCGFPNTRYDDQVDSTSQFINWAEARFQTYGLNPIPWGLERDDSWMR